MLPIKIALKEQRLAIVTPACSQYILVYRFTPGVTRFLLKEMLELSTFRYEAAALRALSRTFEATPYLITATATSGGEVLHPGGVRTLGTPGVDGSGWPSSGVSPVSTGFQWMGGPVDDPDTMELPRHGGRAVVTATDVIFSTTSSNAHGTFVSCGSLPLDETVLRRVLQRLHTGT